MASQGLDEGTASRKLKPEAGGKQGRELDHAGPAGIVGRGVQQPLHQDEAAPQPGGGKDGKAQVGGTPNPRADQIGQIRASLVAMRASGGQALPAQMQADVGGKLGADLSAVRVYDNPVAHAASAAMGAIAFTAGTDIGVSAGFDMSSEHGDHVMKHELVHVAQNQRSSGNSMEVASFADIGPSDSPIEAEAEAGAAALRGGQSFSVSSRGGLPAISRYSNGTPTIGPAVTPGTRVGGTGGGDGDIGALMNSMADPAAKGQHQKFTGTIDGLRLSAMQFSYTSTSFFRSFTQAFVPTDNLKEHGGQLMGNTVYNQAGDALEQAQQVIERVRGFIRIIGDLAAAVGTWMGLLGLIADGLVLLAAVFPPAELIAIPIKKIVDFVGAIPWIVKAATDILDAIIGFVQIVILITRARRTTNPAERARIAQQMKKEAGDLVSACASVVMSLGTAALSAAVSASANTLMGTTQQTLKRIGTATKTGKIGTGLRNTGSQWWKNFKTDFKSQINPMKKREAPGAIAATVLSQRRSLRMAVQRVQRSKKLRDFPTKGKKTVFNDWRASVQTGITGFTIGAVSGHTAQMAKAPTTDRNPTAPTANPALQQPGAGSNQMSTMNLKLWIWPAQLEQMKAIQGTCAPAKVKVMEAYQSARSDCDPALLAQFDQKFGKITQQNGRLRSEALHQRTKATEQVGETARGADQQQQADQKAGQAQGPMGDLKSKGEGAKSEATSLQPVPQPPDDEGASWIKRGIDWAYDNTIGSLLGPVNAKIQQLQSSMTDGLTKWLLKDFSKEELDMAGIGDDLRGENQKEKQNVQQATEAESESKKIDAELKKIQQGRRDTEVRATNTMMDALQLLEQLDQADADITEMITDGTAYLAEARQHLEHQRATETGGKPIDAAYVAPVVNGINEAKTDMTGRSAELQTIAQEGLADVAASVGEAATTSTWAGAAAAANAKIAEIVGKHREVAAQGIAGFEAYLQQTNAQLGTQNYATITEIGTLAQTFGNKVYRDLNMLEGEVGRLLQLVRGEMERAYNECIAQPDPATPADPDNAVPRPTPVPSPQPAPTPTATATPAPAPTAAEPAETPEPTPEPEPVPTPTPTPTP